MALLPDENPKVTFAAIYHDGQPDDLFAAAGPSSDLRSRLLVPRLRIEREEIPGRLHLPFRADRAGWIRRIALETLDHRRQLRTVEDVVHRAVAELRSEEHTSELQSH